MMKITAFTCGIMSSNCYFVEENGEAVIIDPGFAVEELTEYIKCFSGSIKYILLTHRHFDHLNAAAALRFATGAEIVIHGLDECGLYDDEKSLTGICGYAYGHADITAKADVLVKEGDEIQAGDMTFKVIETPGHTPGGVCYLCGGVLFSGDTLFKGTAGRTDLPDGSIDMLIKSLKKLKSLPEDTAVYPGHGSVTTIGEEKQHNSFMRF